MRGEKVVIPTHHHQLPPPPPLQGNIPGTHFCQRLSRPQGHTAAGRTKSIKNSNDTNWKRSRDLPAFSSVPQPAALPPRSSVIWFLHIQIFCDFNAVSTGESLPTFLNAGNSSPIDTVSQTRRPDHSAPPIRYPYLFPSLFFSSLYRHILIILT
jgi:hypothetical protein